MGTSLRFEQLNVSQDNNFDELAHRKVTKHTKKGFIAC